MPVYCGSCGKRRTGAYDWQPCPACNTVPKRFRDGGPVLEAREELGGAVAARRRVALFGWPMFGGFVLGALWLLHRCLQ